MEQPLILAVVHDTKTGDLLSDECKNNFALYVAERINGKDLIVFEGAWKKHIYAPGTFLYPMRFLRAQKILGKLTQEPFLGWRDPRWKSVFAFRPIANLLATEHDFFRRIALDPLPWCFDVEQLTDLFSEQKISYRCSPEIHRGDHALLRDVGRDMNGFDEEMIVAARSWEGKGAVFIVCGALHAVTLRMKTGWPIHTLFSLSDRTKHDLAKLTIASGILPDHLGEKLR